MTRLIMRRGPQPGRVFDLTSEVVTIGSGTRNAVTILDNDVSREHCRLIRVMADYELHDLNSTRGTFVSGQKVTGGWLLRPGEFIELGENVTLEYERSSASAELEKVAGSTSVSITPTEKPPAESPPYLVMTSGPKVGQRFPLKTASITIGRDLSSDIVIPDPEISRFHLKLQWSDTTFTAEDLGSTNGTMLNGLPLVPTNPKPLHANDTLLVATTVEFRYSWQPDDLHVENQPKAQSGNRISTKELAQLDTGEARILRPANKRQTSRLGTGLTPGALADHLFIAYAREEWETIVAPLTVILQDAGTKVWVDQYLTQGGDDWMIAVEQALSECWLLVVVLSPGALESRYVRLAYRYFFNREKPIIPLLYAGIEDLPPELRSLKLVRYDSQDRKKTFDELLAEVKGKSKN